MEGGTLPHEDQTRCAWATICIVCAGYKPYDQSAAAEYTAGSAKCMVSESNRGQMVGAEGDSLGS